jgi:hypothetical protein
MTEQDHIRILNKVFGYFQQVTQWVSNDMEDALKYTTKAEELIDLLEVDLFGMNRSRFKRGHDHKYELCGNRLYDRFYFIVKELECENRIDKVCYFDVENMYQYFKQLCRLRESFNNKL